MTDLKHRFSRKEWKHCCGKGCRECQIAQAYLTAHGRDDGLALLRVDRHDVLGKKGGKKQRKKSGTKGKKT